MLGCVSFFARGVLDCCVVSRGGDVTCSINRHSTDKFALYCLRPGGLGWPGSMQQSEPQPTCSIGNANASHAILSLLVQPGALPTCQLDRQTNNDEQPS